MRCNAWWGGYHAWGEVTVFLIRLAIQLAPTMIGGFFWAQNKLIQACLHCHQNFPHHSFCWFVICTFGQILLGDKMKMRKPRHAVCIGDRRNALKIFGLKTWTKENAWKPTLIWKDNIKICLIRIELERLVDWIRLAQDRSNVGLLSIG